MQVFPVVSSANRARVAASKTSEGAYALVSAVNKRAGNPVLVHVGEPVEWDPKSGALTFDNVKVPVNPPMGGKSDPNGWVLDKLVENATAARRATRARTTAAKPAAKATAGKATAAKRTTATRTRAKVGAAA